MAELSLSPIFRRQWSSLYKAIEKGEIKEEEIAKLFVRQVPGTGVQVYPLDSTMWAHPASRTLTDLVYGRSPTKALKKHSIVQGHEYSLLGWTVANRQSWVPTMTIERVEATKSSVEVGVKQVQWLCQQRRANGATALDVIVADGQYGNHHFFGPLRQEKCALLARLRQDRVLYRKPDGYSGRGRPRIHGTPFAFKVEETWGEPNEECQFEDERWGRVHLRRWNGLHEKKDANTTLSVVCAQVHQEREKPPRPLWLGYLPGHTDHPLPDVWSWYDWRWPTEPSIRFRKQGLFWTVPALQDTASCDRWTWLIQIAFWFLFLAKPLLSDCYLPWQKPAAVLTPARVKRAFPTLFSTIGTPASSPQTRGNSSGWLPGKPRQLKTRFKPVKRGASGQKNRSLT